MRFEKQFRTAGTRATNVPASEFPLTIHESFKTAAERVKYLASAQRNVYASGTSQLRFCLVFETVCTPLNGVLFHG